MTTELLIDRHLVLEDFPDATLDVLAHLRGFDNLRIFIHGEEKLSPKQRKRRARAFARAVKEWQRTSSPPFGVTLFYDSLGVSAGCCSDWQKNMWLAWENPKVERIIYLPYDVAYMKCSTKKKIRILQSFIDKANRGESDLLLGTYTAVTDVRKAMDGNFLVSNPVALTHAKANRDYYRQDIPKNALEDHTCLELQRQFPNCMAWFIAQRTDATRPPIPRTGWFSVSRRLYDAFVSRTRRAGMAPWAGTVQIILCAGMNTLAGNADFRIDEHFVGDIKEPPSSFGSYGVKHQSERISYVIRDEMAYWSHECGASSL